MKTSINLIFTISLILVIFSCVTNKPITIEAGKLYRFYSTSSPISNRVDLPAKAYRFLKATADTMGKDEKLMINIVSYREEGYYDVVDNENCAVTGIARDFLMSKGISRQRITHAFGRADMDKNITHQGMAGGKSSSNCWLETQLFYSK